MKGRVENRPLTFLVGLLMNSSLVPSQPSVS